jgi:hypothetical protein
MIFKNLLLKALRTIRFWFLQKRIKFNACVPSKEEKVFVSPVSNLMAHKNKINACAEEAIFCCPTENSRHIEA